jgi:predicted transcriptional regulator
MFRGQAKSKKIVIEISARLPAKLSKVADEHGQSRNSLAERALERYLEVVDSSQDLLRLGIMEHFRRSTRKNRKLHQLLGK